MTKSKILLVFLTLKTLIGYTQNTKEDSLFNKFKSDVQIEQNGHLGVVRMDHKTRESYYLLLSNSSIKFLIEQTNDSNAFLRSHIFIGLLQRKVKKEVLFKILDSHKNDTVRFEIKSGCIVTEWTVKDFMKTAMEYKLANKLKSINYKSEIKKIRNKAFSGLEIKGLEKGLIDKEQFLKLSNLTFAYKKIKVLSFTFFTKEKVEKSISNVLTNEMKLLIENTQSGDVIIFDDIKILTIDNSIRRIDAISVRIK